MDVFVNRAISMKSHGSPLERDKRVSFEIRTKDAT